MAIIKARTRSATTAYDTAEVNENDPRFQHVQAFRTATLKGPGMEREGAGVLEQLVIGAMRRTASKAFSIPRRDERRSFPTLDRLSARRTSGAPDLAVIDPRAHPRRRARARPIASARATTRRQRSNAR